MKRHLGKTILLFSLLATAGAAHATETKTYTYDALGRLTKSVASGDINNGLTNEITYDAANNRTQYKVTGSPNNSPPPNAVVVVPLNGFTVIPIYVY